MEDRINVIPYLILALIVPSLILISTHSAEAAMGYSESNTFAIGESNTFSVDTATSVLLSCETHPDSSLWYNHNDPVFSWTDPFIDPRGYYFILDEHPSTEPTDSTGQYILKTQLSLEDVADGTWYLHLVAEMVSGKLDPGIAHHQINIDTSVPKVSSTSHPDGSEWSRESQVELGWTMPRLSSAANFHYILDDKDDTIPTKSSGKTTQETELVFVVSDGEWYLHIVWEDLAGNAGEAAAHYAIKVDGTAPSSVADLNVVEQDGDILLTWSESVDAISGVDYYQIYRSEIQEVAGKKISEDGEVTTGRYIDAGAGELHKTLYYTVLPVDKAGNKQTEGVQKSAGAPLIPPSLSILTPSDGGTLPAGTTSTTLSVSIANHSGAWNWKLDEPFPASGVAGGNKVALGNSAAITGLQDSQNYTIYVALVDEEGNLLSPSVTANVSFSVQEVSVTPGFVLSANETIMTTDAGGSAVYVIMLQGKGNFQAGVMLHAIKLPPNVQAKFSPETVNLSAAEPFTTSLLTLTLPGEVDGSDYPHNFTVLAVSDGSITEQLTLTIDTESEDLILTSLALILEPSEVPFMGEVHAKGQLSALSETPLELDGLVIKLIFTAPDEEGHPFECKTETGGKYQMAATFLPGEMGDWSIRADFEGNASLRSSNREDSFTVTKGQSDITFDTPDTGILGTEVTVLGHLNPQLKGELLSLKILRPDGRASTLTGIVTEASGVFRHILKLDMAGTWEIHATWPGNNQYEEVTQTLEITVSAEVGKVILVLGGGSKANNPDWVRFNSVVEYVHKVLLRRGFDDEKDIYFLSPDPKATAGADNVTSLTALDFAITGWAARQVNRHIPLYLYLISHNLGDSFLLEKSGDHEVYLSSAQLDDWLDQLPEGVPVTVIIEACHSGNFIRTPEGEPTRLVSSNRTIIVSSRGDRQAKILANRSSFSTAFFERISANKTIGKAFRDAEQLMERLNQHKDQFPQIDADGDGKSNTSQDYAVVMGRYFPTDVISLANPPQIIDITPSQRLSEGVSSLSIRAELLGVNITSVSATVIPPDFDPTREISNWSDIDFPEFDLAEISIQDNRREYAATYAKFTIPGDYYVVVNAENPDGSAIPVQTVITVPGGAITIGDVNNDGSIRSNDAILVLRIAAGLMEPTSYQKSTADMNGDGKIKSNDAILLLRKAAGLAPAARAIVASRSRQITVTIDKVYGVAGESVTIPVKVDHVYGLAGGYLSIICDSEILRAVDVLPGPGMLVAGNTIDPGSVQIAFAVNMGSSGETIAEIRFNILTDDISHPEIESLELYSPDGLPIDSSMVNRKSTSQALPPERSALLQNFPNPFNPETWIPYQLREGGEVTIQIFSASGEQVRCFRLGYIPPGIYVSRDRAAYWDGRNEQDEEVASGVYFYQIQSGKFSAIRKMLITK